MVMAIGPSAWAELPAMFTQFGRLPDTNIVPVSLVLSGLVFAGAGGVNNLAQSNWIRDKGFGRAPAGTGAFASSAGPLAWAARSNRRARTRSGF